VFTVHPWDETDDPIALAAGLLGGGSGAGARLAIGDHTWARFVLDLQAALPQAAYRRATEVLGPLRAQKDPAEVEALRRAALAVDAIAADLQAGAIPLVGRTEADVSADLGRRIVEAGHQRVNFAIVAAGENAASPHHEAGERVVRAGEVVLCDFGGTMLDDDGIGYCSDITRCVHVGEPSAEVAEAYAVLLEAQQAAVRAAVVGTPCEEVDATARRIIADAGYGERFIHRTGHGIGVEEHEDPYIVAGNGTPLVAGHAFSVEPGIYVPGRFGLRLEDIVVAADAGPDPLNLVDHHLAIVEV
jgi:Xaa-Pro aminopeptidase